MTDATNLIRIVQETQPDEIYNLAAQSHVQVSFETLEYTANADGLGTLRLLEAIRILNMERCVRFYQASTSELYGKVQAVLSALSRAFRRFSAVVATSQRRPPHAKISPRQTSTDGTGNAEAGRQVSQP
jgi:GDP-mannose 4,6-dehydratase